MVQTRTPFSNHQNVAEFCRHEFDTLEPPKRARVSLGRGRTEDLESLAKLASSAIGSNLAELNTVKKVLKKNPNSVLLFKKNGAVVGVWAMLMLSSRGLEQLLLSDLDTENPDPEMLVSSTQEPAAIYVWAVVANSLAAEGIRHVSAYLRQPLYARANLYARAATRDGKQILSRTGFKPLTQVDGKLYRYARHINRPLVPVFKPANAA